MARLKKILILSVLVCLCICTVRVCAHADDVTVDKILATSQTEPVALMEVSRISMYSSSQGCSIAGLRWYDASGNALTDRFKNEELTVEVTVSANDGYIFSQSASGYVYNGDSTVSVSADGKTAVLRRTIKPHLYAPTVIKNPGSETVDINGFVSFVVSGIYYDTLKWKFVSPDGTKYSRDEMDARFPSIRLDEDGGTRMNIYEVVAELNGWKVMCDFSGPGGTVTSGAAEIKVNGADLLPSPSPEPSPTPEPTPTPTPTPSPTPEPTQTPEPTPTPTTIALEEHEHSFSAGWSFDDVNHWHECTLCSSPDGVLPHQIQWEQTRRATRDVDGREEGTCSVCGYHGYRSVKYSDDGKDITVSQGVIIGVVSVIAVGVIFLVLMPRKKGKH